MVLLLFAVASCVHFLFLAWKRSKGEGGKGLQISLLARRGSERVAQSWSCDARDFVDCDYPNNTQQY